MRSYLSLFPAITPPPTVPVYPLGDSAVIETYGCVRLQATADGYFTVYDGDVLQCATPDRAFAVREFWAACGFD